MLPGVLTGLTTRLSARLLQEIDSLRDSVAHLGEVRLGNAHTGSLQMAQLCGL